MGLFQALDVFLARLISEETGNRGENFVFGVHPGRQFHPVAFKITANHTFFDKIETIADFSSFANELVFLEVTTFDMLNQVVF